MTRWLDSSRIPDLESIRKVCAVLGVPAVAGMIAAGRLKPDDVGATVVLHDDLTELTNAELLARGQAILEALAARIPDDDSVSVDDPAEATPFLRRVAPVVTPSGPEGRDWAALDRQN
jgi:hypothetical protein